MGDARRAGEKPRDYRKEEWIAHDVDARQVDATARGPARGRFFVCAMVAEGEPDEPTRSAYKDLGYRLLATEGFFVHRLTRIPKAEAAVSIERVRTTELAARLGKMTRTRPIAASLLVPAIALGCAAYSVAAAAVSFAAPARSQRYG